MNKTRLLLWVLMAWPLPALIAGALGWKGIWGSGSALTEFLIPIPVAGGVLHVPSFLLTTVLVLLLPNAGPAAASRMRALLLGLLLAGVLWLLNLHDILLALKTGQPLPLRLWDANPLGLFVACDAVMALLFTLAAPQRPWLRLDLLTGLLLLLPLALPVSMSVPRASADPPFRAGMSQNGSFRGDETLAVFTRLDIAAPDFRALAEAWASEPGAMAHPRFHISAEDTAVMFTRSREAAQRLDKSRVEATLCQYEDGTPSRWLQGAGDCFSDHLSFSERLAQAAKARPRDEPPELRNYLSARMLCEQVKPPTFDQSRGTQLTATSVCDGLARQLKQVLEKYPDDPRLQGLAR